MTRKCWSCLGVTVGLLLLFCCPAASIAQSIYWGTADGCEEWGYVDVRPGAHMFWWFYKSPNQTATDWPILLWLQGGPGVSGVGFGNFGEIGPLTMALLPRQHTWLRKAHLLFVDSPVGTGFSYVDHKALLLTKDEDVAADLISLLVNFFVNHEHLQSSPLFIFAESYGGKHAALLGLALNEAIKEGYLSANLGGVALGNSWISPIDSVLSWGPVLRSFSRIDDRQEHIINKKAQMLQASVDRGAYLDALASWSSLEAMIFNLTNNVDFYNLLDDVKQASFAGSIQVVEKENSSLRFTSSMKRLSTRMNKASGLPSLMNGPIRKKLQIIPDRVIWRGESDLVFRALGGEFMKDVISKVDLLLTAGVNVTIYGGQLDLICANEGTEAWIQKLKWAGKLNFQGAARMPVYCNATRRNTDAFVKTYKNLAFYWILRAGANGQSLHGFDYGGIDNKLALSH